MTDIWCGGGTVTTLLNRSVQCVIELLPRHVSDLHILPANLKDKVLHLMCKRGLVTDSNISQLLHDNVTVLDLTDCEITNTALELISSRCPVLRKIDLNSTKEPHTSITSYGVSVLAQQCRHLQVVYLRRCLTLDDEAVVSLSQCCPHLRELNVGGCALLTDRSLEALGQNSNNLQCLNMSKASVTDDGVCALVSGGCANTLQELHMNGCVAISDEAVEAIVTHCLNLSILLVHGCPNLTEASRESLLLLGQRTKVKQVTWTIY